MTTAATPPRRVRADENPVHASVVDLFCGVGGLSYGFAKEGFEICCGYDVDEHCRFPFVTNVVAPFVRKDIYSLTGVELNAEFAKQVPRVLLGCAPCQPFSTYNQAREDPQWHLLSEFARLVEEANPDIVSMENVPRLANFRGGKVFESFISKLRNCGYQINWGVLFCPDYGVPQTRSRLVLIGSRHGEPKLPTATRKRTSYRTVRDAIGRMPMLESGESDSNDRLHRTSQLSRKNLRRIRASVPGGSWKDWSADLVTDCHKRKSGKGYSSVYGRMEWDSPAPTITTQFYGFGSGRFGHPEQDRGLSLREGALLQTFPKHYAFVTPDDPIHFTRVGRMIGNAVPVGLARAIARAIKDHLKEIS